MWISEPFARFRRAFHYQSGELMGLGSSAPVSIDGDPPVWLAFHGYGNTPDEMRLVVDVAKAQGNAAMAPLLVGHGTHARDLAGLGFDDWVAGARHAFSAAAERGPVLLVGQSLGSLIAVQLALEAPERVLGLVMLANAFFLHPFPAWPLRWVDRLGIGDFGIPKSHADIGDEAARSNHLTYSVQPVRPAISLLRAGQRLFEQIPSLACPTLIVHGAKDRLCPVSNAWRVAEQMTRAQPRVLILPRSHHIVTRDVERELLARELAAFSAALVRS